MASSEVDICNSALVKVGSDSITALTDNSKRARLCNLRYGDCRDEVLYAHPWNFAVKRVTLAKTANTPAYEYTYEYQLPSDVGRVLNTDASDTLGPSVAWAREGDKILTDESTLKIRYIAKITDVSLFNDMFKEVLALRIAMDIAYPLTQSNSLATRLGNQYMQWLKENRSFNGQERGSVRQVVASEWRDARF